MDDQKYNTLPTRLKKQSLAPKKPPRLRTDNNNHDLATISNKKSKLSRSKSDPLSEKPLTELNENHAEQKVLLTPIEEEASKNPKSSAVTDYLKEIINEIDNESFDLTKITNSETNDNGKIF